MGYPQDFFDELNREFNFTLDPCATSENAKCAKFYTVTDDGLKQDWQGEVVFCNPPYGREIKLWVQKCYEESRKPNTTVVMLIPARLLVQAIIKRCQYIVLNNKMRNIDLVLPCA
ncbi:MAG: DNA N-6-adenine-methyltransferase [Desulfitobacteriaceae bacterium]|nr:DNA N-6-adenine-methyltransferase [Desulfitobacteriaceae bacterium]